VTVNGSTDTLNSELAGLLCAAKQAMRHRHQLREGIPRSASREETLRADHPARYPGLQCFPPSSSSRMNCLCGSPLLLLMPVQRSKLQEAEHRYYPLLRDGFHLKFSAEPIFPSGP
jgi:hypothetical protein